MMTESAAKAMNSIKVDEAIALHVQGKCMICGNGQVVAIVSEDKAQIEEYKRCERGY